VRIQTRWRATTTATTTAKAKTLIRKNIDISDLLIQNALVMSRVPQAAKGKSAGRGNVVLPHSRRAGAGAKAGTWVQGETEAVSSCAIFGAKETRGGKFAASRRMER
jgi:hypothetical protein